MMSSKTKISSAKKHQQTLWTGSEDFDGADAVSPGPEPATDLMKTVAARTMNQRSMKKVFSLEEIEEILAKRDNGEKLTTVEQRAIEAEYRRIKRHVKEMEKGNNGRVIVVPSIKSNDGFYKVFDFSALYYVYRLADRMGRSAKLMNDNDRYSKMIHAASLVNIDKFIEQFKRLENPRVDITEDGIYIFTLKKPLTDTEVAQLRLIEETRRDKLHNILKPKNMDPAVFQAILMVVRQVAPKVKKLERHDYYAIGEEMLHNLNLLLTVYFDYTNGVMKKDEAGKQLIMLVDSLFASLAILSEERVWDYSASAMIGENINEVRRLVFRDFSIRAA